MLFLFFLLFFQRKLAKRLAGLRLDLGCLASSGSSSSLHGSSSSPRSPSEVLPNVLPTFFERRAKRTKTTRTRNPRRFNPESHGVTSGPCEVEITDDDKCRTFSVSVSNQKGRKVKAVHRETSACLLIRETGTISLSVRTVRPKCWKLA